MRLLLIAAFCVAVAGIAIAETPVKRPRVVLRDPHAEVCVPYEHGLACVDLQTARDRLLANGRDDCE